MNRPLSLKSRRNVGLLVESSRSYGRGLLRGIASYSRTVGNWSLLHQEMMIDSPMPAWLTEPSVSGIVARVDSHNIERLQQIGVPVVDVRCRHPFPNVPQVETNDRQVAELAFEHLWQRGFRRFAFCGYHGAHYSENRLASFRDLALKAECALFTYQSSGSTSDTITRIEHTGMLDVGDLSAWLTSLELPIGMFVCNDIRGQQVLNACRALELYVPDDIGVIGVDDDDAICPLSDPPLSSVRPDAELVGYRAAETLDAMMMGRKPHLSQLVSPTGVVQRLSTQVSATEDRELAKVCRFIRERACDGINVSDVAGHASMSRRQLERRFKLALGRTLHQEITNTQVRRVKQLLVESTMTIEKIAPLAGYGHKEQLSAVFKRETGTTPAAYRRDPRGGMTARKD